MILEQENIISKHAGSISSHVTCMSLNTKILENKSSYTPQHIRDSKWVENYWKTGRGNQFKVWFSGVSFPLYTYICDTATEFIFP